MRGIQITQFGKPEDVVRVVDLQEPNAPGAGEVKVAVEFSPLNLHDLKVVRGELGRPPTLQTTACTPATRATGFHRGM
ncbi:hypothetical protein [Streptomyces mirabilis]|uniref:hypothetical protein n=1 Tax=Streptomyces mirabilis TaxID=68239 RepID=UPI0032461534